uniref:Uncharacterized protein n=1 Tax=Oryza punctata TaxID=4537 RepID=A0A0E0MFL7_ORYPU
MVTGREEEGRHHRVEEATEKEMVIAVDTNDKEGKATMLDDEKAILEQQIVTETARLEELRRINRKLEIKLIVCDLMSGRRNNLDDLSVDILEDVQMAIVKHRLEIRKRIKELRSMDSSKPT